MFDPADVDFAKGLVPAVVQDVDTAQVLMVGYMNADALAHTLATRQVTFYSRSKARLWTKGEQSGHVLALVEAFLDCDGDTILIHARPNGPTCHTGTTTCFGNFPGPALSFLGELDRLVSARQRERPAGSYTTRLFDAGVAKIAQKVGEEGVETALAGVVESDEALLGESADLIFHLLVLLRSRGLDLRQVANLLRSRHSATAPAKGC
jgi:phosphoribosyl-ATP pyrophosphohydrolase/phosphoribosyl-AMP cyclohydrolase